MSAPERPIMRAWRRCSGRSFDAAIEMKMMLSTPRTISRTVRVAKLIQTAGSDRSSSIVVPRYDQGHMGCDSLSRNHLRVSLWRLRKLGIPVGAAGEVGSHDLGRQP